ncbi:MAG: hypothetical protein KUA43_03230 [Hoeflea sp.]|uniref:hypothetical protein n=1 Tax=Hoeflea sp. TaxID=1940281 RepID=UPI001DDB8DD9|nr:hypothetical protein [Hoeflea sp.]MBU4529942.1 hypothetical protein [Alphaproteobacteria bacterium]MBU4543169.1 hypothetical protein [Alphaproteobacteria bacterium]MBU4550291.1 hypothetical protein [Alphaproteobacteria bacterium]MBV1722435.1 hypothetical protein [Hoeflea sp.]MBV1761585.1 hypothetical protein [Hoeflea sp.]
MANIDETLIVASAAPQEHASYVDWPAIFGGIVLASGVSVVLMSFGAAMGLTFTAVADRPGAHVVGMSIGVALWFIWVQVSSFMAGAYLTGRMRKRFHDSTAHEVEVRDGAHGLLVWGGAIILGALIAASGLGAVTSAVSTTVGATAGAVGQAVSSDALTDEYGYFADSLLRPAPGGAGTTGADDRGPVTAEVLRILSNAGSDEVSEDDRAYLGSVVAARTGLGQEEATARVDSVLTGYYEARTEAAEAAETARRVGIISAFLIAASLLVSGAGSYWAATAGGAHRDERVEFDHMFRRVG